MMKTIAFLAVVAALAVSVRASDVVTGTDANFADTINNEFVLVEFYAPWCGHCKKLAPEWEQAATQLKGKAVLVALDATVEKNAAQKYDIKGFPTIKVFRDGELAGDYEGGRTADAIVKYVKSHSGPAVTAINSEDELAAAKNDNRVLVAGFFDGAVSETFESVAKQLRSVYTFVSITDKALFGGEAAGFVVFKHFDEKREVFEGDATDAAAFKAFVQAAGVKLVDEIGPDNYKQYVDRGLPMAWLFIKPDDKASTDAIAALEAVGTLVKGKVSLVYLDGTKYGQMGQRMGLSGNTFPAVAIDHEGKHFAFDEKADITSDSMTAWFKKYLADELEQTVRSEDAPNPHTVKGVTTVVGSTFDDLVINADKDVFIEFYAPWCGHCKKLAPTFDKLGAALDGGNVRIAKIDATANDYNQQNFNVQGFPTMYFVPKGKEPMSFDGDRSYDGMLAFIKKHATGEVNVNSGAAHDEDL